jgi:riboflavin synthase
MGRGLVFTGLIEHQGRILAQKKQAKGSRLEVESTFNNWRCGDSIAINGVCLTVLDVAAPILSFDLSPETLSITNLGSQKVGEAVNIEPALQATTRLGGHYVTGHVDTTAHIVSKEAQGDFVCLEIGGFKESETLYLVPKGSITVDGVSLTINAFHGRSIEIMLVPHTLQETTLSSLKLNQQVNIEFDYLARIVAHQLRMGAVSHQEVVA